MVLVGGVGVLGLAGCAPGRDTDVTNDAAGDVLVRFEDGGASEPVTADGGMSVLGVADCDDGPVVVTDAAPPLPSSRLPPLRGQPLVTAVTRG